MPFKSSLFAAAKPGSKSNAPDAAVVVQTVAIVYARVHGVPLGRADRPLVGWYGDMDMQSHAWGLLQAGPLDVVIRISPPVPLDAYAGRKELAEKTEAAVRENVVRTLRARPAGEPVAVAAVPKPVSRTVLPRATSETFR